MIDSLTHIYESSILIYGTTLLLIYALLTILSLWGIVLYQKKNRHTDFNNIVSSPLTPGISIIAPAYNEGLTIISNVRSLLTLDYPLFEVIIINDGSTDDTLEKLVKEFYLVEVDFAYNERIISQPVKRFFKSTNKAYDKLMIIDKVNGKSKADGSNVGINAAAFDYFLCTDVDCILGRDTLLKMIRPFMDGKMPKKLKKAACVECGYSHEIGKEQRVIASGAALRMTNSSDIERGVISRFRPPSKWLPRFQEMEYIRAFVLGKMGWSMINCVPNVSGGLGMFDKEIAIKAGGYDHRSFAEDIDLVTRMCVYMLENNLKYAVRYIPTTQCWTEGPPNLEIFSLQRTRWARGLVQIIGLYKNVMFNPKYGKLGMVIFPYIFIFEFLAPIVEFIGILYYLFLIISGEIYWHYALVLLLFVYVYSIMITTLALLWDQLTFRHYKTWYEVIGLCLMAFLEPICYHPLIIFFSLKGYIYSLFKRKSVWGTMLRQGFETAPLSINKTPRFKVTK